MQSLCLIFLLAAAALVTQQLEAAALDNWPECGAARPTTRIYNGTEAIPGQLPFQAYLTFFNYPYCGAVIIDSHHLLTAARCPVVVVGAHSLTNSTVAQRLSIDWYHPHERYVRADDVEGPKYADIAVIRTKEAIRWHLDGPGAVNRICMPPLRQDYQQDELVKASGWGRLTKGGLKPDILRVVDSRVQQEGCPGWLVCTRRRDRRSPCRGDSGGPVFRYLPSGRAELAGIVSYGPECDGTDWSGHLTLYNTNVSHFLSWIESTIAAHNKLQGPNST